MKAAHARLLAGLIAALASACMLATATIRSQTSAGRVSSRSLATAAPQLRARTALPIHKWRRRSLQAIHSMMT